MTRLEDLRCRPSPLPTAGLQVSRVRLPKGIAEPLQVAKNQLTFLMKPQESPMRIFQESQVIFVRVPKNASNSIMATLYPGLPPARLPHYSADFYARVFPRAFRSMRSFALLRHPMDRFASAFTYYRHTSTKPAERRLMDEELPFLKTLLDFVHWLNDQPDLSQTKILRWHHFHPQSAYVTDARGRIIVDLLFPVEKMGVGLQVLGRLFGRVPELERLNESKRHHHGGLPLQRIITYYADDLRLWNLAYAEKTLRSARIPPV
ncbi:MAG: sulfotransferase family 2 domain-containing protein [Pseudomonadota bacterium]